MLCFFFRIMGLNRKVLNSWDVLARNRAADQLAPIQVIFLVDCFLQVLSWRLAKSSKIPEIHHVHSDRNISFELWLSVRSLVIGKFFLTYIKGKLCWWHFQCPSSKNPCCTFLLEFRDTKIHSTCQLVYNKTPKCILLSF